MKLSIATFGALFLWWLVLARVYRELFLVGDDRRLASCAVPHGYGRGKDSLSGDNPIPVERFCPVYESLLSEGWNQLWFPRPLYDLLCQVAGFHEPLWSCDNLDRGLASPTCSDI